MVAYGKALLAVLQEVGAKEKNQEEGEKNNNHSPNPSQNSPKIDQNFKDKITNLPLVYSKKIAKNKVRELFKKYRPDIKKIKEC